MQTKNSTKERVEGRGVKRVPSRSVPGTVHFVDVRTQSCSCRGFSYRGECRHLRLVNAQPHRIVAVHDSRVPGLCYDVYGPQGWEGRCVSWSDAYEVIVEDLGGVLGEAGVGGYFGAHDVVRGA